MREITGTDRGRSALRIGAAIAMLPLVALLLTAILFGEPMSILGLIPASAGVLVAGLLIRQGGGQRGRMLGGVLALSGAVVLAGSTALALAGPWGY